RASVSGKAVSVTLGNNTGTAFYVNTGATYTGNLVQLQVNAVDKLKVDASGNTTLGGTLTVRGASITGPSAGAFAIDNGNASAINLGNNSGAAPINIGTANAGQISIGRSTQATVVNSTLQSVGDLTVGSPVKLTITATTGDLAGNGLGTFGGGLANQIRLSGSATTAPVVLSALGSD